MEGQRRVKCRHRGQQGVKVGDYEIFPAGNLYLRPEDLQGFDLIVPLTEGTTKHDLDLYEGLGRKVKRFPWPDYQPPPDGLVRFLRRNVIPALKKGKKVMVHCAGGHGRTGSFLAVLIALTEPEIDNPVAEVRSRYCYRAVETDEQERAIARIKEECTDVE